MAQPTTARFGAFTVSLGDGGTTEMFVAPCGFTSKSLTLSKSLAEIAIPDCDDPDAPFYVARDVQTQSWSVGGEGLLAEESLAAWIAAYESAAAINVEVEIVFAGSTFKLVGAAHLESFAITSEQGGRVQVSVSMQSDGQPEISVST